MNEKPSSSSLSLSSILKTPTKKKKNHATKSGKSTKIRKKQLTKQSISPLRVSLRIKPRFRHCRLKNKHDGTVVKQRNISATTKVGKSSKILRKVTNKKFPLCASHLEEVHDEISTRKQKEINRICGQNMVTKDDSMKTCHQVTSQQVSSTSSVTSAEEILRVTRSSTASKSTKSNKITMVSKLNCKGVRGNPQQHKKNPMMMIPSVTQIPPMLDWIPVPYNIHVDDGSSKTDVPVYEDDSVEKNTTLTNQKDKHEKKVHNAKAASSSKVMKDEILYHLINGFMEIEDTKNRKILGHRENNHDISNELKAKFKLQPELSAVAAKVCRFINETVNPSKRQRKSTMVPVKTSQMNGGKKKTEKRTNSFERLTTDDACVPVSRKGGPSNAIFSLISQAFEGKETTNELWERYHNVKKVKELMLMPKSNPTPNVDDPNAEYLPSEISKPNPEPQFCRMCWMFTCFNHIGKDKVDMKYYKNRKLASNAVQAMEYANSQKVPECLSTQKPIPKPCKRKKTIGKWQTHVINKDIMLGLKLPTHYSPCVHAETEECNSSCSCRKLKISCEKFCLCPPTCSYRFPGCKCKSTCHTNSCMCLYAGRECDLDLCLSCRPNNEMKEKITCRNDNIQRKRDKPLQIKRSDVNGWGVFSETEIRKGEFIAEFKGELISQKVADIRGAKYDKNGHTFLFDLDSAYAIDGTHYSCITRFLNSSNRPNCETRTMLVYGAYRIGFYAKRNINANEELFIDYEDVLEKHRKLQEEAKNANIYKRVYVRVAHTKRSLRLSE